MSSFQAVRTAMTENLLLLVVSFLLVLLSPLYDRIRVSDVPAPFRGMPILLVTAALVSLALMGFKGLLQ